MIRRMWQGIRVTLGWDEDDDTEPERELHPIGTSWRAMEDARAAERDAYNERKRAAIAEKRDYEARARRLARIT